MAKKTTFWQGWLMDNPLTEDPNDFTLKVKAGNMVTTEDIAKALQAEGSEFQCRIQNFCTFASVSWEKVHQ